MTDDQQEKSLEPEIVPSEANASPEPMSDDCAHCGEYKSGWQRALADYQNLQRETTARRSEWAQMSKLQILEDFIPVYDNFKKAFAMKPAQEGAAENWAKGIQFIMKQFGDVLKNHQIEEIKTVGEQFDPTRHESVGEEMVEGKQAGVIVREAEGGYLLGGKVVKVAKVIIAK